MSLYQAESFYRARISSSITETAAVPITIRLSKLPTRSEWLLTISPNTEYEEIVEFGNVNPTNMTIDITKRWISPVSIALTIDGTDYNNASYQRSHTQNDIIRGDVNHLHINQGIGNSTLATNVGVGIVRLATAPVNALDPVVVGTNDPRVGDASTTQKATVKLSVAPVSSTEPIALGANDPIVTATDSVSTLTDITTNNVSVTKHWYAPKSPNNVDVFLDWLGAYSRAVPSGATLQWLTNSAPTWWLLADWTAVSRTTYATLFWVIWTVYWVGDGSTTFNLPNINGRVPVGRDSSQTEFDTLGETWGAKTHTLTEGEMPAHSHTVPYQNDSSWGAPNGNFVSNSNANVWTFSTWSKWSNAPHNNLQPYIVLNYIIKT